VLLLINAHITGIEYFVITMVGGGGSRGILTIIIYTRSLSHTRAGVTLLTLYYTSA
jgi:hypothetical protein